MKANDDDDNESETGNRYNRTHLPETECMLRSIDIDQSTKTDSQIRKYKDFIQDRSLIVDILAIFFGIGSWIGVCGTYLQVPLLVEVAPERWSLPSYLGVVEQLGNIGPLLYSFLQKMLPGKINESKVIYFLLGLGTVSAIFTAFLYDKTATIAGQQYSIALYIWIFCAALTGCTSSVLFMPYMGRFKEIYLITYLFGEGLSGLLPSVMALIQGVGGNTQCILNETAAGSVWTKYTPPPRFGTMDFFIFIFSIMLCSCIGFILLDRLKLAKKQYAAVTILNGNTYIYKKNDPSDKTSNEVEELPQISPRQYKCLLILIGVVSFFAYGVFNSIQSYSTLPYGSQTYHLTASLSAIADPVACLLAVFLPHTSIKSILKLSGIGAMFATYILMTAAMSPNPPFIGSPFGGVIVVTLWTLLNGIVGYVKLCITSVMRAQGGNSLVRTGAVVQIGGAVGSVLIFILINHTSFFTEYETTCG